MASNQKTVDHILEQIKSASAVSARKMFGEYTIYCDEKVVALVADDQLFVKPTSVARNFWELSMKSPPMPAPSCASTFPVSVRTIMIG